MEDFSLAPDRAEALKLLIPGTRDYYYYTALDLQNQGKYDEVEKILAQWIKRHKTSGRTEEIQNRQALLRYRENAKKSLDYLRHKLGLTFSHAAGTARPEAEPAQRARREPDFAQDAAGARVFASQRDQRAGVSRRWTGCCATR